VDIEERILVNALIRSGPNNSRGTVVSDKSFKSNSKAAALAVLMATAAVGYAVAADMPVKNPPPPKPVPFFLVNDTSVSFTWYFNATDPGISGGSNVVPGGIFGQGNTFYRAQGAVDHFDVWQYGTNLIHVEADQYGPQDPIQGQPGSAGAREFFGFTRSTLGFNELTHSKMFDTFLTNDVAFEGGFTAGTENNYLAEETTQYLVGAEVDVKVPKPLGTLLVGIMARKEFSHNEFDACGPFGFGVADGGSNGACAKPFTGFTFDGDRNFNWTWTVETFYALPLGPLLGSWANALKIVNIANVVGPKGTGISTANCLALGCFGPGGALATNTTKTEVFEDGRLNLDASSVFWGKQGIWDMYVGYRYWYNKFGTDHNAFLFSTIAPGTSIESTAYLGTTYHFK